jgi:hypothetical protein
MRQVPKRKGGGKMKTYLGIVMVLAALSFSLVGQVFATGSPDFSLSASCDEVYFYCGPAIITLSSINGFSGTVTLTTQVTPYCTHCSLTAYMSPGSVSVPAGGNATSTLKLGPSCHQYPNCQWDVTVTGQIGTTNHSIDIFVCVGRVCPV